MKISLAAGTQTAPYWTLIAELSERWSIAPWIWSGGKPLLWMFRAKVMRELMAEHERKKQDG